MTANSSKDVRDSDLWGAANDTDVVPPFCYECLETDTKSTTFFLLACSKIMCERCRIRLINSDGLVKCSAHNVFEKCIKLDDKLPSRLKGLFRNDDESKLRQISFHIEYIDKLHNDLSNRLQQLPPEPTDEEMQLIDSESDAITATERAMEAEMNDELTKLGNDLKSAEKMDAYFKNYAKMMTQPSQSSVTHHQRLQTAGTDNRFKTPNIHNNMMSVSSITKSTSDGRRTRDDSGYGINHRSEAQRTNKAIAKSTPLSGGRTAISTPSTLQYSLFRKAIEQSRPSATGSNKAMPTPLKSILKNSGSRQNPTTPSTTRGTSGGQVVSIANVRPKQPADKVYQQVRRTHPQPDFFRSRSNLNADEQFEKMPGNPTSHRSETQKHHQLPKTRDDYHQHRVKFSSNIDVEHPTTARQSNANDPRYSTPIRSHPVDRFLDHPDVSRRINQLPQPRPNILTVSKQHNPQRNEPTVTQLRQGTPHPRRDAH